MKLYPWSYARIIGRRFIQDLRDKSCLTLRLWTDHCEYIMAQRFRRGHQIMTFYNRLWDEKAFRELMKGFRRQVQRHMKGIMLSSVGIYAFDWNTNRINYDSLKSYMNEIDFVEKLRKERLICSICHKRKIISEKLEGMEYCKCPHNICKNNNTTTNIKNKNQNNNNSENNKNSNNNNCCNYRKIKEWEPYLEKGDMIIWRKEEKQSLYAYKVYVKYPDVTAEDFLHVQTDIEYRKKWDDTALALEVIDTDPEDSENSQVIYWEMRWPKLFANRDYVYIRRYITDLKRNLIVICNKSTDHPKCPVNPNKQRVNEYWSYMVIKPFETFNEPGLEFVLTYFDDPGLAIPSTITSWVAQKQMPEFLYKLYYATKDYAEHKKEEMRKKSLTSSWGSYRIQSSKSKQSETNDKIEQSVKKQQQQQHHRMKMHRNSEENDNEIKEELKRIKTQQQIQDKGNNNNKRNNDVDDDCNSNIISNSSSSNNSQESVTADLEQQQQQQEKKSWWSCFHPYYFFA